MVEMKVDMMAEVLVEKKVEMKVAWMEIVMVAHLADGSDSILVELMVAM
jgi:hypothetical protein